MFAGYRTIITAVLVGVINVAEMIGYIPKDTSQTLTNLLLGGGLAFLRLGVKNDVKV